MTEVKLHDIHKVPMASLLEADWNANEMSDAKFAQLVESIKKDGFREPIHIVPTANDRFRIIGGHHRYRAAKILEMEEITAVILDEKEYTEDIQKVQSIKMNVIHGKISPQKFTKIWVQMNKKYDEEVLRSMMGFESEEAMKGLIKDVARGLPEEFRDKLKKSEGEIKTIDDLATVIKKIYAEHGEEAKQAYMFFQFGGKTHLMIQMNKELREAMDLLSKSAKAGGMTVPELMIEQFVKSGLLKPQMPNSK